MAKYTIGNDGEHTEGKVVKWAEIPRFLLFPGVCAHNKLNTKDLRWDRRAQGLSRWSWAVNCSTGKADPGESVKASRSLRR